MDEVFLGGVSKKIIIREKKMLEDQSKIFLKKPVRYMNNFVMGLSTEKTKIL